MAFLAGGQGIPVAVDEDDYAAQAANEFSDSRTLAFRSLDGSTLLDFTGDEYIARWGITGLDMAPRVVIEQEYPGQDGSDIDDITISSRLWAMPLRIGATSGHRAFLDNRDRLAALLNHRGVDYRAHGGTFDVVATSGRGERSLRSVYVDGMSGDWQQATSGSYFETLPLQGRSVRPYWTGARWSTPPIQRVEFSGLGRFPLSLSPARTLGSETTITVPGDVDPYVRIDAGGPAPYVEVTGPGLYFLIPDGLAAGETMSIDCYPPTRQYTGALFNGVLDWRRVAPQRQFGAVTPGDNLFTLDLGEAGLAAYATVSGPTLYERPW